MYKHILPKEGVLPNKLHDELASITEPFSLLHNKVEVMLQFKDIKQMPVFGVDAEGLQTDEVIGYTYAKRTYVTPEPIDGIEQKPVEVWSDYTEQFEQVLTDIQAVVDTHNPVDIEGECDRLDAECQANIFAGFTLDLGTGEKHFKCDMLNQSNIDNLWMNAQLVQQGFELPEGTALEYNTSDDECLENLTVDQCLALWVAKNTHVYKYRKQCELDKKALKNE